MAIQDAIERFKSFKSNLKKVDEIVNKIVEDHKDVILSLNREQMLLGRDIEGNTFKPGYMEDPYFKTKEKAQKYKSMKQNLESAHRSRMRFSNAQLYADKDSNTPNLIVTGKFQEEMFINVSSDSYTIGSTYIDSPDIEQKYNNKVFGLAPRSKEYFSTHFVKPELLKLFKI